ncbi:hypothetical protein ACF0H5_015380 [Mactra antiquata]
MLTRRIDKWKSFGTVRVWPVCDEKDRHLASTCKMAAPIGNFQTELQKKTETLPVNVIDSINNSLTEYEVFQSVTGLSLLEDIEWITTFFDKCNSVSRKSNTEACNLRNEGNKLFQKQLYQKAMDKYTEAIFLAETGSAQVALAYGNRSAVLYRTKLFKECVKDIDEALKCSCPSNIYYKVLMRKANCKLQLNQLDEARTCVDEIRKFTSNSDITMEQTTKNLQEIEIFEKSLNNVVTKDCTSQTDEITPPTVSYSYSNTILQASSAVCHQYNTEKGRFLVACKKIKPGDTLIVEKPFAAVLLPEHYDTHCHHCFVKVKVTSFPCRQCIKVRYCSMECSTESWEKYHYIECKYLTLLHSVGIAHLSLRIVITAGLNYLLDFRKKHENDIQNKQVPGFDENGQYCHNYLTVYKLMTHIQNMDTKDLFQYTLTAQLLLKVLQHADWFNEESFKTGSVQVSQIDSVTLRAEENAGLKSCNMTSEETYIGGLLLRHILQLVCNAHAITDLQCCDIEKSSNVEDKKQVRIATAIYPTASLMNHSCDPTIISSFYKDTLVVRATKHVDVDDEIFNCYGPHYIRMNYKERQQCLKEQYFFTCTCKSCMSSEKEENIFNSYLCKTCMGPAVEGDKDVYICKTCKKTVNIDDNLVQQIDSLFQHGYYLLNQNKLKDARSTMLECYNIAKNVLYKHNKQLSEITDCIARCYAMLGEFSTAADYVRKSLDTIEVMYGANSVEVGNELQKLSEILISAQQWQEALKVTDRACVIFELNYGKSHDIFKDLSSARKELTDVVKALC